MYLPFGGTRWESGATPTDFQFTGQRQEAGFGLYDYHARYYDPLLGRFVSADAVVPGVGNPQALNRYSYVNNNPLKYIDPTGHFTQEAIENYLKDTYQDDWDKYLKWWQGDKEWWDMLRKAQAGDYLVGASGDSVKYGQGFMYRFTGSGQESLTGVSSAWACSGCISFTLGDIQRGFKQGYSYSTIINWFGWIHDSGNVPEFHFRQGFTHVTSGEPHWTQRWAANASLLIPGAGSTMAGIRLASVAPRLAKILGVTGAILSIVGVEGDDLLHDVFDIAEGNWHVSVQWNTGASLYFNFEQQLGKTGRTLENFKFSGPLTVPSGCVVRGDHPRCR
jgi:RHS repeat-associated protein